jgi:NADPH2:quinone reductase
MTKMIRIHRTGGPEVLSLEEVALTEPGPEQIQIAQTHCGVNYIDTYFRSGLYPVELPFVLGQEGAGEVIGVGSGVDTFRPGDRVAYSVKAGGGYAQTQNVPATAAVRLPEQVSNEVAAATFMKGLTAQMLCRQVYRLERGMVVLVHAAAGGVGSILAQWASSLGAIVIGTVGSEKKAAIAKANGCAHVILYQNEDFSAKVREVTNGDLCDVVYDGIGKSTVFGSLDCLRARGMFVSYGNASGAVDKLGMLELAKRGSLFATRPMMPDYASSTDARDAMATEFFDALQAGAVDIAKPTSFALSEASEAHRALESRETTGSIVLHTAC